ncbi:CPBP family intramembrane metalloprotease [Rubrobacter marinus]|uniref:CPBP family intramembrane metalloprotease n=1 Tax=Rubrobacter marinus TaxID=2653852 RepID=A0A6G8Q169_9ACTN|nr:CPBP family intramembrane glutamic endopeptidase [Rubrobacter marinus]QIN80211.1 CPBP family intramembrane metalloprotease [Rubrobacter marinus]
MRSTWGVARMLDDPGLLLLSVVAQNVVLILLTVGLFWAGVFVARRLGSKAGYGLDALGVSRPRGGALAGAGIGFLVGLGAVIGSLVIGGLSAVALEALGFSAENEAQQPLLEGLRGWVRESPGLAIGAAFLVIVLFGPAVEEFVFRGAIFGGLYRLGGFFSRVAGGDGTSRNVDRFSFLGAALFSSAGFAALHQSAVIAPALFALAFVLCALYRRTGSLLPPIVAHATFNSFTVLAIALSALYPIPPAA